MSTPPWFALPSSASPLLNTGQFKTPVIIVGSGLAGCHTAYALAQQNVRVLLVDSASKIAAGASANQAGIVKPFVTRSPSLADQFYHTAFKHLLTLLRNDKTLFEHAAFTDCGVLQLLNNNYPNNPTYANCTIEQASQLAGIRLNSAAIHFADAGWLNSAALCKGLVQHSNIDVKLNVSVNAIKQTNTGWLIHTESSADSDKDLPNTLECQQLILANGERLNQFTQTAELPITPARGQTSRFCVIGENPLRTVITGKRYVIPVGNDIIVGASFTRNNTSRKILIEEHEQNRVALNDILPAIKVSDSVAAGFSGVRGTTPDRLPVLGPVPDFSSYCKDYALVKNGLPEDRFPAARYHSGLSVIGGMGSRGIVSAPYCAKLLADFLTNGMSQQSNSTHKDHRLADWSALLHPGRFSIRALKRA